VVISRSAEKSIGEPTVDWHRRENARARMRTLVERILRKQGYPSDLQDAAVQTVIKQAEAILGEMKAGTG
jgi:type I restriction enzyme R subunit